MSEKSKKKRVIGQTEGEETKLKCAHALGFLQNQGKIVQHLDDDEKVIYQIGQHIAKYDYEKRNHKFLLKSHSVEEIICFCVSKGRKYIALSEETSSRREGEKYQVSVYELQRAKTTTTFRLESNKSYVISMDFSRDGRHLVAATCAPECGIYIWNLQNKKRIGFSKVKKLEVFEIGLNPFVTDTLQISAMSETECRVFHFEENELKSFDPLADAPDPEGTAGATEVARHFTTHSWYDDESFLLGTKEGDILVIEKFKVVRVLKNVFQNELGVYVIQAIERGFLCGGESGFFLVFERSYNNAYFQQYKLFQTGEKSRIIDLCVSKREENVICSCENNQMVHFNLANVDILKENENNFTLLPVGFHHDTTIGIDTCVQKSILITCSNDNTVRVWNYLKRTVELTKRFNKDVYSISLHPNGLQILIAFRYNLCLYSIINNDLYKCCEWLFKGCKCVKFSNGGHLFAATISTNIIIVSTVTFQPVTTLRGHNGIVRDLVWGANDLTLTSAGYEGAIYEWDLFNPEKQRVEENIVKTCSFHSCVLDEVNKITGGIGNDKKLWYFTENNEVNIPLHVVLTAVALSKINNTLFLGTADGRILLYKWPLPETVGNSRDRLFYREYNMHRGKVLKLILSFEEKYLFSIGDDGCLLQLEILSIVDNRQVVRKPFEKLAKLDDLTYIMKTALVEHSNNITSLEEKMHQVMLDAERQVNQVLEDKRKQIDASNSRNQAKVELLQKEINQLKQQAMESETASKHRLNTMEAAHLNKVREFERHYKQRLDLEKEKFHRLEAQMKEEISDYQDKLTALRKQHSNQIEKMRETYMDDKKQQITSFNQLGVEYEEMCETFKEMKRQSDDDYVTQLENQRLDYEKKVEESQKKESKALKTAMVHRSEIKQLKQMLLERKNKIDQLKTEKKRKIDQLVQAEHVVKTLKDDLRDKEIVINANEKKMQEQKNEISELEKLRYVLTFKFNSLKKDVLPKDKLIGDLKKDSKGMNKELIKVKHEKDELNKMIDQQEETLRVLRNNIASLKNSYDSQSRKFKVLLKDLQEMTEEYNLKDPKIIIERIKGILSNFTSSRKFLKRDHNKSSKIQEFERQREHAEQKITTLKTTLLKKEKNYKMDINRKTMENSVLVGEVNVLRRERKMNQKKIRDLEIQIRNLSQSMTVREPGRMTSHSKAPRVYQHKRMVSVQAPYSGHTTPAGARSRTITPVAASRKRRKPRPVTTGARNRHLGDTSRSLPEVGRFNRPLSTGYGYEVYNRLQTPESVYSLNDSFPASAVSSSYKGPRSKGKLIKGSVFSRNSSAHLSKEKKDVLMEKLNYQSEVIMKQEHDIQQIGAFVKKINV